MHWLHSVANSWRLVSDFSLGDWDWFRYELVPKPLLYPVSSQLRHLHSPNPQHIGISGDPPLCRACKQIFSDVHILSSTQRRRTVSLSFARLRASAELGCYVCAILYNAEWNSPSQRSDNIYRRRLRDGKPHIYEIYYVINRPEGDRASKYFHLDFTTDLQIAESSSKHSTFWVLNLLLIPDKDVEEKTPMLLSSTTSPDVASELAMSWIEECQRSHKSCMNKFMISKTTWKPTRVIYVGLDGCSPPRLCLSSEIAQKISYTALSHCWGHVEIFKLLSTNLDELLESIPRGKLTPLFQDAIDLTRRLGIEYIWIDSLCIIQDSRKDWEVESATMGDVYKNSHCTIAATGFKDGGSGLYVTRDPYVLHPRKFNLNICDKDTESVQDLQGDQGLHNGTKSSDAHIRSFYLIEDLFASDVAQAPLSRRAWAYQERVLSTRIFHLGRRQMFWECQELEACETFVGGMPKQLRTGFKAMTNLVTWTNILKDLSDEGAQATLTSNRKATIAVENIWRQIKAGYNDKNLTFQTDKIIAISGLAREMQKILRKRFVAGLWEGDLVGQLLWFCPRGDVTRYQGYRLPPSEYQAPSWSWLSINETVDDLLQSDIRLIWKEPLEEKISPVATVVNYQVTHKSFNNSEFGQISQGFIRIRSRLYQASFIAQGKKLRTLPSAASAALKLRSSSDELIVTFRIFSDRPRPSNSYGMAYNLLNALEGTHFYLLFTHKVESSGRGLLGLVLGHNGVAGQYRRLGIWCFFRRDEQDLQDFEKELCALESYIPLLDKSDYEEQADNGDCTVTII